MCVRSMVWFIDSNVFSADQEWSVRFLQAACTQEHPSLNIYFDFYRTYSYFFSFVVLNINSIQFFKIH